MSNVLFADSLSRLCNAIILFALYSPYYTISRRRAQTSFAKVLLCARLMIFAHELYGRLGRYTNRVLVRCQ